MLKTTNSLLFSGLMAISATFTTLPALAHDDAHEAEAPTKEAPATEVRIHHYEVAAPETKDAALTLLEEKMKAADEILAKGGTTVMDLESLHELSYSLEAAVDKLRASAPTNAQTKEIDALDEAVQAFHSSSENHEEKVVREWFTKMQAAAQTLLKDEK